MVWQMLAGELRRVKAVYYGPLLRHFAAFFGRCRALRIREIHAEDLKGSGKCCPCPSDYQY